MSYGKDSFKVLSYIALLLSIPWKIKHQHAYLYIYSLTKGQFFLHHIQGWKNPSKRALCILILYAQIKMSNPQVEQEKQHMSNHETHQKVAQSVCSVCHNRRPQFERNIKREFSYVELHAATQGFSPKNFLSEGGFGSVYKGELCGQKIAVKQHMCANRKGEKEFKSEVDALSKAIHENVVMLLGSCSEGNHRLLVYEYVCNGSLDQHLSRMTKIKPNLHYQDFECVHLLIVNTNFGFLLCRTFS